nr:isoform 2 of helicase-like transcription factor [Quercus suber]
MVPSTGAQKRKREIEVVDLVSSDFDEVDDNDWDQSPARKHNATAGFDRSRKVQPSQAYHTPPSSSAPTRSQRNNLPTGSQRSQGDAFSSTGRSHSEAERTAWLSQNPNRDDGDDEDDDNVDLDEIVSSTQAAADNDELRLYGCVDTKIVGVQYYRGLATPGEYILMRREPGNPYDGNAIRIDNIAARQIGHIPKRIAEKLAKYMDRGWLMLEGRLTGSIGQFDCPLMVQMYGPDPTSTAGRDLAKKLTEDKLPIKDLKQWEREEAQRKKDRLKAIQQREAADSRAARAAAAGQGGRIPINSEGSTFANQTTPSGSSQPVMADILEASERFNPREVSNSTDKYGVQEDALKEMPMATQPEGIATQMLPYQLQALHWLLQQENQQPPGKGLKDIVQLWQNRQRGGYTNIATNFSTTEAPQLASGGILADDMGLGKTLEMISLMVADAEKNGRGTTLIVAPLSVMSNWSGQIQHHMHKDKKLSVYTYHGAGRVSMDAEALSKYDVVITTYQTLATDYMPRKKGSSNKQPARELRPTGLYSMEWRRVILDEGHIVRNPTSKGAAAVTALMSKSRWALTGTPIVNSLRDLWSLLRFVGLSGGLEQVDMFNRCLIRPLKSGDESAILLLKAIMAAFTLRRRKEMKFIDLRLPKLDEFVHTIEFTKKERERYEALHDEAKGRMYAVEKGTTTAQAYQHLLETLLRMRQCCNHWNLCGERVTNLLAQLGSQKTVSLTPDNVKALQDVLQVQIESQEDCAICLETLHNPVITNCGHAFGRECISKVIENQHKCPMCRAQIEDETCLVEPTNDCGDESADDEMDLNESSSKLESLMQILKATKKGDKTVVFSQWTRFLDIIQVRLDKDGFTYCRLDGTMSAGKRDAALETLETDTDCTIMLASLGVCAVGLNLTAANQIILSDTWWAPAIEDQAVDRVHRLGQKKETRVFRLVMEDSIEQHTLGIQAEKRKLMMLAFSERDSKRLAAKQEATSDSLAESRLRSETIDMRLVMPHLAKSYPEEPARIPAKTLYRCGKHRSAKTAVSVGNSQKSIVQAHASQTTPPFLLALSNDQQQGPPYGHTASLAGFLESDHLLPSPSSSAERTSPPHVSPRVCTAYGGAYGGLGCEERQRASGELMRKKGIKAHTVIHTTVSVSTKSSEDVSP